MLGFFTYGIIFWDAFIVLSFVYLFLPLYSSCGGSLLFFLSGTKFLLLIFSDFLIFYYYFETTS